ncbi:hypothetical protein DPX39_030065300 [Trypanosoma brucei equiperdum]|uniref:Uncharacterized protein n=1 Tax=Trypanosoma brucei equiperdum TaxID=630700 RepID=A0A3L6LAC3_9TRYP|nr:hypothetical protein DPX39_030055300 [Trypanosoma brucei equiperdum]RHW73624.1 hypothetical protein DPX39_030060300 [Trypanosoma brucei equiperdum]RHW73742.1 hypothetical protein DPX39_030070300 [Trypanosoma brucei equiperdum]RHW73798.1 hypothetical protein DPX39_030065300 [Trypanosoma brucei equiperdum]
MKGLRLFFTRPVFVASAIPYLTSVRRVSQQRDVTPCGNQSGRDLHSSDVVVHDEQSSFTEDMFASDFDELEAASQEIHDLCFAMINYLQKTDPDETSCLFQKRCARGFRETVPENKRRLLHERGSKILRRRNCYRTKKEYEEATQLFLQFGEKLLLLLTKPVVQRIIESAGKVYRDHRRDGVHRYRKPVERGSWRGFPHRWFKHAPFEVQQLRADIPEATVANTRAMRDLSTVNSLFTLMEPQHPFRAKLENQLFEITQEYDVVHAGGRGV